MKNRIWADEVEKNIVNELNNIDTEHEYAKLAATELNNKFNILEAHWTGSGNYDENGDIKLITDNGDVFIELKASAKTSGGTTANVSQAFFKDNVHEALGYTDYEDNNGITAHRQLLANTTNKKVYEKTLRDSRSTDKILLNQIVSFTNTKKPEYIDFMLPKLNKNKAKLSKLLFLLKNGIHTKDAIKKHSDSKVQDNYYILFITKYNTTPAVRLVNPNKITYNVTNIERAGESSIVFKNKDEALMRFSVHWKNICQGGATPCFTVFS